ncbi:hypothetical protein SUGI_0235290 [Cryptomeria japonica]|nr:hypothetical protein SUGI_0235290 [Cryptomeria japonica]
MTEAVVLLMQEDFFITLHDVLAGMPEATELNRVLDAHVPDFFITLHDVLAGMPEATELNRVLDAHVPAMKFKFRGISIDFLCSIDLRIILM